MRDIIPFFNERTSLTRSLGDSMDKLLNEMFSKDFFPGALAKGSYPKMNVYDDQGQLCVDAYVPDLPKDKVHLEVKDKVLTLKGDSNQDREVNGDRYYCREVSRRAFSRSIRLPENLDDTKITAEMVDGMLKVRVPYKDGQKEEDVKKIEIK
jgi:HSP20 family protein